MPRGPVSRAVVAALRDGTPLDVDDLVVEVAGATGDVLLDEDLQIALWTAYELHYGGLEDVDEEWEWDPDLLRVRRALETRLEDRL
ncbi:MAG: iron-containing redox enzyme family protein, partial [Ornithinibacter sp.]